MFLDFSFYSIYIFQIYIAQKKNLIIAHKHKFTIEESSIAVY